MKTFARLGLLCFAAVLASCAVQDFTPYHQVQWKWPTGTGVVASTRYAVPVYTALPARPYIVLGSMHAEAIPVQGNAFIEYEARKAKEVGGDAVIIQTDAVSSGAGLSAVPPSSLGSRSGEKFATWWGNTFPGFSGASALVIKFK